MFVRDLETYDDVTDVFAGVAAQLADTQVTVANPKDLCIVLERCDRDGADERDRKERLVAQFLDLDCPAPVREKLRADVASCVAGELPIVRRFSFNAFNLTMDARFGGGGLVDVVDDSPGQDALFTFDELAALLAR